MSSSLTKGLRRSTSRPSGRRASAKASKRVVKTKSARPKAKRASVTKASARKPAKIKPAKKAAASRKPSQLQHNKRKLQFQESKRLRNLPQFAPFDLRQLLRPLLVHQHRTNPRLLVRLSARTKSFLVDDSQRRAISFVFYSISIHRFPRSLHAPALILPFPNRGFALKACCREMQIHCTTAV